MQFLPFANKNSNFKQTVIAMENKGKKTPEQIAWSMFEKTGNPAYYMLYKKLKGLN